MSFKNNNEDYDELVTPKKGVFSKFKNPLKKTKFFIIILLIGVIIGILLGQYYIQPLLSQESNVCKNCLETNQLLSKENECLYTLLDKTDTPISNCLTNVEN